MSHIVLDARIMNSSTGRYVERLVHYLEEVDTTNRYSVLLPTKDLGFYTPRNPNFTVVEADFANYSFAEQFGLLKLLKSLRPDLVHFCMPQQPVLYRGKKVTTMHDLTLLKTYNSDKNFVVFKFKQFIGRIVFRYVAKSSKKVIAISDNTKREYQEFSHIPDSRIVRIYEAADKPDVTPNSYEPLVDKDYIMYVGSESDYKNVRRLIEAHQLLLQKNPDLLLVLVGKLSGKNGIPAARNKAWSESQHHKNVVFTDFVPDDQLAWLYEHTKAYIFPSLMEGFGLPGLEAMLYGAPVVSSNATCLPEVYGDAAIYFDPTNVINMADTIRNVLDDEALANGLAERGFKQVAKYSWRTMAEETLAVYNEVLTNSPVQ